MPNSVTRTTRPDGLAVFRFDRPGAKANVLTADTWADFEAELDDLPSVAGLLVISTKPGIFIAGADLKLLGDAPAPNDPAVAAFIAHGLRVLAKLEALPCPTAAVVDGAALGGGLEVALACDYRVCGTHPRAELGLPESKLGLIPGWGGTVRLPKLVGTTAAAEMLSSGASVTAERAKELGLADDVVSSDKAEERAAELLSLGDWQAKRERKRPTADEQARETAEFLSLAGGDESKRRIAAFFAARGKT